MRRALPLLLLVGAPLPARAAAPPAPADRAVARGLAFLRTAQQKDGHWGPRWRSQTGITSLAVMAFLSAGHAPDRGPHGEAITRAVRAVLKDQRGDGLLGGPGGQEMYNHGLALLMLGQAHAVVPEGMRGDVRKALDRAVALSLKAQQSKGAFKGGWRYRPFPEYNADAHITGWNLLALLGARGAGCAVPAERLTWAADFLRRCVDRRTGAFRYQPSGGPSVCCTADAALVLAFTSKDGPDDPDVRRALAFLSEDRVRKMWAWRLLGACQALHALSLSEGEAGARTRAALRDHVLREQKANGSWLPVTAERSYGPDLCTALGVLALTAPERLPPFRPRSAPALPGGRAAPALPR